MEPDTGLYEDIAITDLKHGWLTRCIAVGCILRDLFPDTDAVLFLTGITQREFVAKFNALLQESLVGNEIQTGSLELVLHKYFKELDQPSIFDRSLEPEDEEYILMSLHKEECVYP